MSEPAPGSSRYVKDDNVSCPRCKRGEPNQRRWDPRAGEWYCGGCHKPWPAKATRTTNEGDTITQATQREAIAGAIRAHYLAGITCDHEAGRDRPVCACSLANLGWHASVGLAADAWVAHVMEHVERVVAGWVDEPMPDPRGLSADQREAIAAKGEELDEA